LKTVIMVDGHTRGRSKLKASATTTESDKSTKKRVHHGCFSEVGNDKRRKDEHSIATVVTNPKRKSAENDNNGVSAVAAATSNVSGSTNDDRVDSETGNVGYINNDCDSISIVDHHCGNENDRIRNNKILELVHDSKEMKNENKDIKERLRTIEGWMKNMTEKITKISTQLSPVNEVRQHSRNGEVSSLTTPQKMNISTSLQRSINNGLRSYVRNTVYPQLKFVKSDVMAANIAWAAVTSGEVVVPAGWTKKEFTEHMNVHVYQAFNNIRHNTQTQIRKRYIGKKVKTR
jgi:hypothetical protein